MSLKTEDFCASLNTNEDILNIVIIIESPCNHKVQKDIININEQFIPSILKRHVHFFVFVNLFKTIETIDQHIQKLNQAAMINKICSSYS